MGCAGPARPAYNEPAPIDLNTLSSGHFTRIDRGHWAKGTATLSLGPIGTRVLRLEESFEAALGPDLYVVLSPHERPLNARDLGAYVQLGKLRSPVGGQNYVIPAELDLSHYKSVVIYCASFQVIFSTAPLTDVQAPSA